MSGKKNKLFLVLGGLFIGLVNGFFGGGGGMIAVPVLEKIAGLKTKSAHATAILIILPISIASSIIYIIFGKFSLNTTLFAGAGVLAGGLAGAYLLSKLSNRVIRLLFDIVMIAAGVKLLFF